MRFTKVIGTAIVAVLAVSAMATGASAHQFESNTTGLLTAKAHSPQLFRFPAGEVVCNTLSGHGIVSITKTLKQVATVQYKNCTTSLGGTVGEPINAEYEFDADESVSILKPVVVVVTVAGVKCTVTVAKQAGLKSIGYRNVGSEILLFSNVQNIESNGVGAACIGGNWTSNKTGEYTGSALVGLVGGTIAWK